jgi:hypothetical protein
MADDNDTSAASGNKPLTPEQEQRLREDLTHARDRREAAAKPGIKGQTPLDQLLLDLARARPRWDDDAQDPEAKRECLIGYLEAFHAFLDRHDRTGAPT